MTYRAHGTGSLQRIRPGIWRSQIKAPDGRRLSATHHVDTKSPRLVGQEATVISDGGKFGVRVRTDDGLVRWLWREHVVPA